MIAKGSASDVVLLDFAQNKAMLKNAFSTVRETKKKEHMLQKSIVHSP
jgi:hypothetical protein